MGLMPPFSISFSFYSLPVPSSSSLSPLPSARSPSPSPSLCLPLLPSFSVLGIELEASRTLGKHSSPEPHSQLIFSVIEILAEGMATQKEDYTPSLLGS